MKRARKKARAPIQWQLIAIGAGVVVTMFLVGYVVAVRMLFPPLPEPKNGIVVGQGPLARKLLPGVKWDRLGQEQTLVQSKGNALVVAGGACGGGGCSGERKAPATSSSASRVAVDGP